VFANTRRGGKHERLGIEDRRERIFTAVAALVDINILVYRFDSRFPEKQKTASDLLRRGIAEDSVVRIKRLWSLSQPSRARFAGTSF
jgi:hypothetical protein